MEKNNFDDFFLKIMNVMCPHRIVGILPLAMATSKAVAPKRFLVWSISSLAKSNIRQILS